MVGLIPLFAVETLEPEMLDRLPGFKRRLEWFIENRPDLTEQRRVHAHDRAQSERRLLSIVDADRLRRVLQVHARRERVPLALRHPRAVARAIGTIRIVLRRRRRTSTASTTSRPSRRAGCSAATRTGAGRSGSRSTTCSIEALQKFHHYYGDDFQVECPTGSGQHDDAVARWRRSSRGG